MINLSLAQTAQILGVQPPSQDAIYQGLSIDTRTLRPGNLFVALKGSRMDGHAYLEEARRQGAKAALVTHVTDCALPQLLVNDTAAAMGELAMYWRNQFDIPVIAITGSNGKTTLKNMISSILIAACHNNESQVLATQGTLNNHLGLPLTLSRLTAQHLYAVIEMGMNHFGEIEYLTHLTRPQVAVITNAAACHLEGVGDLAGVAKAKAEIFSNLPVGGFAILNRDDAFYTFWRDAVRNHSYLTFGFHPDADIQTTENSERPSLLMITTPKGSLELRSPLLGKHNILNALAAIAATLAIGIQLDAIKEGLEKVKPAPGRLQLHTLANGINIIDDTYNANPFSLQAAIHTLATFKGQKILVLGDMKELGQEAQSLHLAAADIIRQAGIDFLFTYGELSSLTAKAFGSSAYHFNEQKQLISALKTFLSQQTTILVKGSRSMCMEKVVAELIQQL